MEYRSEPLLNPNNKYQKAFNQYKDGLQSISQGIDFDVYENIILEEFEIENENIISHIFQKERERLNKTNTYFYGCSFDNYKHNYETRLNEFKALYIDVNECDFIESELKIEIYYFITGVNERQINFSLKARNDFLNNRKSQLTPQPQQTAIVTEPEAIDLSDTTATEKIIYLQKLGVIDFLRTKQPFQSSTNSLATVLSAITGINPETKHIQSMLNPIINKEAGQKNNPLNSNKAVERIEKQLINIGFNLNETN